MKRRIDLMWTHEVLVELALELIALDTYYKSVLPAEVL